MPNEAEPDRTTLDAFNAFLETLSPADRTEISAALAEISASVYGALPVPRVRDEALLWEVPEGSVSLCVVDGRLEWSGRYGEQVSFGNTVHPAPGSPEAVFGNGLLDFIHRVLARRAELEALRDALLRELNLTQDRPRLLAYLSDVQVLPDPTPALPGKAEDSTQTTREHTDADKELGRINFDAYAVSQDGESIPSWEEIEPDAQTSWIRGALAVATEIAARNGKGRVPS